MGDQNKASTKPIDLKNSPSVLRRMAPFCRATTQQSSKSEEPQVPKVGDLSASAYKTLMRQRSSRQSSNGGYCSSGAVGAFTTGLTTRYGSKHQSFRKNAMI